MAHPLEHAKNSARKFGGAAEDYLPIHEWFDESKAMLADFRHRALRHHAEGIFLAERIFGVAIRNSQGKDVPVRYIGEQHVREDLGRIPSFQDWAMRIKPEPWMYGQKLTKTTKSELTIPISRIGVISPNSTPTEHSLLSRYFPHQHNVNTDCAA